MSLHRAGLTLLRFSWFWIKGQRPNCVLDSINQTSDPKQRQMPKSIVDGWQPTNRTRHRWKAMESVRIFLLKNLEKDIVVVFEPWTKQKA